MAYWFKFYETDLTDPRLQLALNTNHDCAIVWIYLMGRCAGIQSDTLRFDMDFDIIAVASALRISVPICNDALRMLEKIEFILIEKGTIKVLCWRDRQTDPRDRREYFRERRKLLKNKAVRKSTDNAPCAHLREDKSTSTKTWSESIPSGKSFEEEREDALREKLGVKSLIAPPPMDEDEPF